MKNRILQVILFVVIFVLSANITAQTYQVDVVANDVWWESPENFGAQVSAVIYLDGQPIPTSSDYFYDWDAFFGNEGYWRDFTSGYGEDGANISAETLPGYDIFLKVTVSDVVNHTFTNLQSGVAGPYNIPGTVPGDKAVDVIFSPKQQNGGNLSLVTPDHWRYSLPIPQWKNGYHSLLTKDVTERIKATPNYVESLQQKLLYWNSTPSDILNFHEFLFTQLGVYTIEAQYWSAVGDVTLQNNFLSTPPGTDPANDVIDFKDPWLVDDDQPPYGKRNQGMSAPFRSRSAPFNPDFTTNFGNGDIYYGVFLNQGSPNWQPPFYSVRAIDNQQVTVNGKSITWDWESWSYNPAEIDLQYPNSKETAVVFKQDGATLTANLKGRRVSDTPAATAPTNGAKLIFHHPSPTTSKPFLVYEDRGNIYKTMQSYTGVWQKDGKVATASGNITNSNPAAALLHDLSSPYGDHTAIAWDEYDASTGRYRPRSTLGQITFYTGPAYPTHPAIAGYHLYNPALNTAVVAFHGGTSFGPTDGIRLWFTRDNIVKIMNTTTSADYPSIDVVKYAPTTSWREPWYLLAWQESAGIQYTEFHRTNDTGGQVTYLNGTLLNSGHSNLTDNRFPSLHSVTWGPNDQYDVFVVWQATEKGGATASPFSPQPPLSLCPPASKDNPVVCFAEKSTSTWQPLTYFRVTNTCDRNPVVTAWDGANGRDVAIAYEGADGEIHYILRQDGDWSDVTIISTDGNYPALTAINGTPHLIWTEKKQSPFRIQYNNQLLARMNAGSSPPHSREITFRLSKALPDSQLLPVDGNITVEIADPLYTAGGTSQPVPPLFRDSLLTPQNGFQYQNILVNHPSASLQVPVIIRADSLTPLATPRGSGGLQSAFLALRLNNGRNHTTLLTLHTYLRDIFNSDTLSSFVITDTFTVALDAFVNREVQVEGQVFFKKRNPKAVVAEVYDLRNRGSRLQPPLLARAGDASLPARFELLQNYPNPFNPSTTITFTLPHASPTRQARITLHVYDINGRQVRTLVNGQMEAGEHQVVWDGTDDRGVPVASGVYFYRLTTGSGFVATRKMVLLR